VEHRQAEDLSPESLNNLAVIICVRNEEKNVARCLEGVITNHPGEILVVDGNSTDNTRDIVTHYGLEILAGAGKGLTKDRQLGLASTSMPLVAFIDGDHHLDPNQLGEMLTEFNQGNFDVMQACLTIPRHHFWSRAEDDLFKISQNNPGIKTMLGVAPTIYRRQVLDEFPFDSHITSSIDDTDLFYRISSLSNFKLGVGTTTVTQNHSSDLTEYLRKFIWYGKGDGEFIYKYPERGTSMLFHLGFRYGFIYPFKAVARGYFGAAILAVIQGTTRLLSALRRYFQLRKDLGSSR